MSTAQYYKPNRKAPDVAKDIAAKSKPKVVIRKEVQEAINNIEKASTVKLELTHKRCRKCSKLKDDKETGCNCGRPVFDGKDEKVVLSKLEVVFGIGGTDEEACVHADISIAALYRYENLNPEFRKRKHLLKNKPLLGIRNAIVSVISEVDEKGKPTDRSIDTAFKYLKINTRYRKEFNHVTGLAVSVDPTNALSDERKAEIATAMQNWSMIEEGDERDEDYESPDN